MSNMLNICFIVLSVRVSANQINYVDNKNVLNKILIFKNHIFIVSVALADRYICFLSDIVTAQSNFIRGSINNLIINNLVNLFRGVGICARINGQIQIVAGTIDVQVGNDIGLYVACLNRQGYFVSDLVHCTNEPNVSIPQLANLLVERTQNTNWVVVYKALITVHHLLAYGNEVSPLPFL